MCIRDSYMTASKIVRLSMAELVSAGKCRDKLLLAKKKEEIDALLPVFRLVFLTKSESILADIKSNNETMIPIKLRDFIKLILATLKFARPPAKEKTLEIKNVSFPAFSVDYS
eukprot:TRINITY_DN1986_c0_g1_i4.p1 TRINITY_DN1986_c0_g1~~TRINITY_DN1986_c0_g1_i4.p1  ORF type:complete len:113 (-),score=15.77 TRINITY_DN1986_c0_g1_i4:866-1204(-)